MGEWALGRHLSVYAKIIILNAWDNSEYFTKELSHDLAIKYMCPINVSYSQCVNANSLPSCLFVTLGTVPPAKTYLSMGFSRQEYWSGLSCPPPGDLPNLGIEPTSLMSPALAGRFFITSTTSPSLFIAALFTIAKIWKQSKCPSTGEWIKMWYVYTVY